MKCKTCGHKYHWCTNCGYYGLEHQAAGYCSLECGEKGGWKLMECCDHCGCDCDETYELHGHDRAGDLDYVCSECYEGVTGEHLNTGEGE